MTPPEQSQVALELERMRGTMAEGFATLNGRLDVALTRTTQAEADIDAVEQRQDAQDARLAALERRMATAIGAALVLGGGAGSVASVLVGR